MQRVFLWMSGADPAILRACHNLGSTERIRFASLGALLLIPSLLGFVSFAYATSTIVPDPRVYLGAGAVWALVVLLIDRYLLATLFKSRNAGRSGRIVTILVRYLFAVVVGVAVAHPFTLLWFGGSIHQSIEDDRRQAVAARLAQAQTQTAALPVAVTPGSSVAELQTQLTARTAKLDCLLALQQSEQAGVQATPDGNCGSSSGRGGCGPACRNVDPAIDEERRAIAGLRTAIAEATEREIGAGDRRRDEETRIAAAARSDVADIDAAFSHDYLAQVTALAKLEAQDRHVLYVEWFMILVFVFVDVMPITMKLTTPRSEYEEIRDTRLLERRAVEDARREVVRSGESERALAESAALSARLLGEVAAIADVPQQVVRDFTENFTVFEQHIRRLRAEAKGDPELVAELELGIAALRELNSQARTTAFARVLDHLKSCSPAA